MTNAPEAVLETAAERIKRIADRAAMVGGLITNMGSTIERKVEGTSVTEFVRLLLYEKDLLDECGPQGPREVKIAWLAVEDEEPLPPTQ